MPAPAFNMPFTINRQSMQAVGLLYWFTSFGASVGTSALYDRMNRCSPFALDIGTGQTWAADPVYGPITSWVTSLKTVTIPTSLASSAFTVMLRFNPLTVVANETPFGVGTALLTDKLLHIRTNSTTSLRFGLFGDDTDAAVVSMTNRWVECTCTLTAAKLQTIYADGVSKSSRTAGGLYTGDATLGLGARPDGSGSDKYTGLISELRIYNRALSAAEVWQLYDPKTRWDLYQWRDDTMLDIPSANLAHSWGQIIG